jgi:hypothetical protein
MHSALTELIFGIPTNAAYTYAPAHINSRGTKRRKNKRAIIKVLTAALSFYGTSAVDGGPLSIVRLMPKFAPSCGQSASESFFLLRLLRHMPGQDSQPYAWKRQ